MIDSGTDGYIFNYRKIREDGYTLFKTDSANLVFTLRDCYMLDVFDLDSSVHIAYLDFDVNKNVMLGYAFGPPAIGLPFTNQFRKIHEKGLLPFRDLRSSHKVGLFVEKEYRNKGEKRLWNLDEILMTTALEIAFEKSIGRFLIKPTGDRAFYYRDKFGAKIHPTTENDAILGIDLRWARKNLKHIKLQQKGGKTHFLRVKGSSDIIRKT